MEVNNKIMYHFNNGIYSDIWQVGNDIDTTDKNFISNFYNFILNFSTSICVNNDSKKELLPLEVAIDEYLKENKDKQTYIKLLEIASGFLKNFELSKRELVLEEYRKKYHPNLPSRTKCIWLCEKKQLLYWKNKLNIGSKKGSLFKVSVTGNLFKSSDQFLPNKEMSILQIYENAKKYWNPDFSVIDERKIEYLFDGKVKILQKITDSSKL